MTGYHVAKHLLSKNIEVIPLNNHKSQLFHLLIKILPMNSLNIILIFIIKQMY